MKDAVRATDDDNQNILANSKSIWSSYAQCEIRDGKLPIECMAPHTMLGRAPKFVDERSLNSAHPLEFEHIGEEHRYLQVSGDSVWRTTHGKCELPPKKISRPLLLGKPVMTPCVFSSDHRFGAWPGVQENEDQRQGNCIGILVLTWCYILSAKWVELQRPRDLRAASDSANEGSDLRYTHNLPTCTNNNSQPTESFEVYLGEIDESEARWWGAILVPGTGWEASTYRSGKKYLSPWSLYLKTERCFMLQATINGRCYTQSNELACSTPPTSALALSYLSHFCNIHDVYHQCLAALATVLLIPYFGEDNDLSLPEPLLQRPFHTPTGQRSTARNLYEAQYGLLPYYMSLSCNIHGIRSIFHSTFYHAGIPCNLASPWLKGAFLIIDSLVTSKDYNKLLTVLSKACIKTASLWLGAIIAGIEKSLLLPIRNGMFAMDIVAGAWTGTPQTFLTQKFTSHHPPCTEVSRSDESLLLYLAEPRYHDRVPICPWEPFGYTDLNDVDLEVREHIFCGSSHCLEYDYWHWRLQDSNYSAKDRGYNECNKDTIIETSIALRNIGPPSSPESWHSESEQNSEAATRSIFGWLRFNGYPRKEKAIYEHPWIDIEESDEEYGYGEDEFGEKNEDKDFSGTNRHFDEFIIKNWLATLSDNGCDAIHDEEP